LEVALTQQMFLEILFFEGLPTTIKIMDFLATLNLKAFRGQMSQMILPSTLIETILNI